MGNRFFWPQTEIDLIEGFKQNKVVVMGAEPLKSALEALIFYVSADEWKIVEDDGRKAMDVLLANRALLKE